MAEPHQILTEEQAHQLNKIYIDIVRKYNSNATESLAEDSVQKLTEQDAAALAEFEVSQRRIKIEQTYNERVANINGNAVRRGLDYTETVLEQLDRAFAKYQESLLTLDGVKDKLAKKILADNQKLALAAEKQNSASKSRSLRDFLAVSKMKLTIPYDADSLVINEVFDAYLTWLLRYTPQQAYDYVNHNALFLINLGIPKRTELLATLNTRRLTV